MKSLKTQFQHLAAGLTVMAMGHNAFAVDVTAAVADIEQAADDIESIGMALLGATLVVVVISFIRRSAAKV
jgi:outer membrane murein-binding lipoprotein Lpp